MALKKNAKANRAAVEQVTYEVNDLVIHTEYDDGRGSASYTYTYGRVLMVEGDQLVVRTENGLAIWTVRNVKKAKI